MEKQVKVGVTSEQTCPLGGEIAKRKIGTKQIITQII